VVQKGTRQFLSKVGSGKSWSTVRLLPPSLLLVNDEKERFDSAQTKRKGKANRRLQNKQKKRRKNN
jgi:hypothetical protein